MRQRIWGARMPMMFTTRNFIYRCPTLDLNVQGTVAASDSDEGRRYVGQRCPACGGLHLVNPDNGKLLAEEVAACARGRKC